MSDKQETIEELPSEELVEKTIKMVHKKMVRACRKLSMNFMDVQKLIDISNKPDSSIPIAAWICTPSIDKIVFNGWGCRKLTQPILGLLVMHEALHRAGYASSELSKINHDICNIAFDIIINKVLFSSISGFERMIGSLYKPENISPEHPLRVVLPSGNTKIWKSEFNYNNIGPSGYRLRAHNMSQSQQETYGSFGEPAKKIAELHSYVWDSYSVPDPVTLFWKVSSCFTKKMIKEYNESNPFAGRHIEVDPDEQSDDDKDVQPGDGAFDKTPDEWIDEMSKQEDETDNDVESQFGGDIMDPADDNNNVGELIKKLVIENDKFYSAARSFSNSFSDIFKKVYISPEDVEAAEIKRFLEEIEAKNTMVSFIEEVSQHTDQVSRSPLLLDPTPECLAWMAAGITDLTRFYINWEDGDISRFALYVDTSPSMDCFANQMVAMLDSIANMVETDIYCFGGSVDKVKVSDFRKGEYTRGASTSFDNVITHAIEPGNDADAICIFTDGYSFISEHNIEAFKETRKKLYVVYWVDSTWHRADSFNGCDALNQIADKWYVFSIPRSMMNGY